MIDTYKIAFKINAYQVSTPISTLFDTDPHVYFNTVWVQEISWKLVRICGKVAGAQEKVNQVKNDWNDADDMNHQVDIRDARSDAYQNERLVIFNFFI